MVIKTTKVETKAAGSTNRLGAATVPLPFVLAALLIVLGAVPGWGVHLALPLAALMVVAAIWSCRPRTLPQLASKPWRAWRWALLGSLFWVGEELVWTAARLVLKTELTFLSDPLYYLGTACWFVALSRLSQRALPRLSFLVSLPALLIAVWLLLQNVNLAAAAQFPVVDLALLLFALPALERAFHGDIPEGRLLWWAGLFVRVLAGALFVWLGDYPYMPRLFFFLWVFAYTFIALGAWLELSGVNGGLWPIAYGLLGLEAVVGVVLAISFMARADAPATLLALTLLLGYLMFTGIMLLVIADRNRRTRAELELKQWSATLEQLVKSPYNQASAPAAALATLLKTLQPSFPELCGISAAAWPAEVGLLEAGEVTPYPLPLITEGTEVGHLYFCTTPDTLAGQEAGREALGALLPLVAVQVERALSHARLHAQALTDPLTGLYNRRSFALQGSTLASRAYRQKRPVGLAVLDIDHFKRVNDVYGHPIGDEALKTVAEILRRNTRDKDHVMRWGGEEFVLLLYDVALPQLTEVVGRIRLELSGAVITPIAWPLTASVGVAGGSVPAGEESLQHWLGAADQALLKAKQTGRDRTEVAVS